MVVIFGNIVSRKPRIRPEFDDAARHFVDGGVLGAVCPVLKKVYSD